MEVLSFAGFFSRSVLTLRCSGLLVCRLDLDNLLIKVPEPTRLAHMLTVITLALAQERTDH